MIDCDCCERRAAPYGAICRCIPSICLGCLCCSVHCVCFGSDPLHLYNAASDPDFGPEPHAPRGIEVDGEDYPDADKPTIIES